MICRKCSLFFKSIPLFLNSVMTQLPTLVFATSNKAKLHELQRLLGPRMKLVSLDELNFFEEIPETTPTLEGNAEQKARFIYNRFSLPCFSDDSGLFIEHLNGAPGVDSAHFSGSRDDSKNIAHVLTLLKGVTNRSAYFKTVFCLIINGLTYYFEGRVSGTISDQPKGTGGFGYDPIFIPEGYTQTFGELSPSVKKEISHRSRATKQLVEFLQNQ